MKFIKLTDNRYQSECGTYWLRCARQPVTKSEREALWVATAVVQQSNRFLGGGSLAAAKQLCKTYSKLSSPGTRTSRTQSSEH